MAIYPGIRRIDIMLTRGQYDPFGQPKSKVILKATPAILPGGTVTTEETTTTSRIPSTTLSFRSEFNLERRLTGREIVFTDANGQKWLIPVIPPHTGELKVTHDTSTPDGEPVVYNHELKIPSAPVKILEI